MCVINTRTYFSLIITNRTTYCTLYFYGTKNPVVPLSPDVSFMITAANPSYFHEILKYGFLKISQGTTGQTKENQDRPIQNDTL